jgi:hypothetical protein
MESTLNSASGFTCARMRAVAALVGRELAKI